MNPITETLEKFNNGEQRYEDDQNFKEAVDSLANGIGVYAVLDKTLNQLRVLREIHAKTIEQNKQLTEEADNLGASNRSIIQSNMVLTGRIEHYESE